MPVLPRVRHMLFHALRLCFRLVPMRAGTRDAIRQDFLDRFSSIRPDPVRGRPASTGGTHRARVSSDRRAIGYVPYRQDPLPSPLPATLIAFYLPQFHPIAENDTWWGKGFTEWRNVTRALPQFEGHAQPRLPGDLGFYDLRSTDTMREQAKLASQYGIGAFCFYFYWFSGRTLLEQPLRQWLDDPTLQLPFCLCWANENWSRRWDGRSDNILMAQTHSAEDDLAFIAHIGPYLRDPRYLRVDSKPLLLVYRPDLLPDAKQTAHRWREWCRSNQIGEIHIAYVQGFERPDPRDIGFDAAVEFPPNLSTPNNLAAEQRLVNPGFSGQVLDWRELAADYSARPMPAYTLYPGVNAGWDNEPRSPGKGRVYLHSSPARYRDWLRATITTRLAAKPSSERLVFINAWNEWAEGAVLEPDQRLGHAWLQATRQALSPPVISHDVAPPRPCVVLHAWHMEEFADMLVALQAVGREWRLVVTTSAHKEAQVRSVLATHHMSAEVDVFENRGRDILPFLHVARRLADEDERGLILKLHTKRSPHLANGAQWRRDLQQALGSADQSTAILAAFDRDSRLGLVAPAGHLLPIREFLGSNRDNLAYLAARIGVAVGTLDQDVFPAGSMFWARIAALRPLLDAHLDDWDFDEEASQLDGTMAHAVERMFIVAARAAGYGVADNALGDRQTEPMTRAYAYADRQR